MDDVSNVCYIYIIYETKNADDGKRGEESHEIIECCLFSIDILNASLLIWTVF